MEKTLAIHLAEQREEIAQWIEGMAFVFSKDMIPTDVQEAINGTKKTIAMAIRKQDDNWA